MAFPVEAVPDGSTAIPHHATYGLVAALVILLTVWDDHRDAEPMAEFTGVLVGLFGFVVVWPWRPPIGASMAHIGPLAALAWMLLPWSGWGDRYPRRVQVVATGAIIVGLDDILEHAWPVPSPLDWGFDVLGPAPSAVVAGAAVVAAVWALQTAPTHNQQTTENPT